MKRVIKNGKDKVFISTCEHCKSDFEYTFDETWKVEEEKPFAYYRVICPACGKETFANLMTQDDIDNINAAKFIRKLAGYDFMGCAE